MKTSAAAKISGRVWSALILVEFSGQFAWTLENMYFNVFLAAIVLLPVLIPVLALKKRSQKVS